jgi:hypothetical protein
VPLRVGNIDIDGSQIHIGRQLVSPAPVDQPRSADPDPMGLLARLGIPPRAVCWVGAALLAAGVAVLAIGAEPINPVALLTRGGILTGSGIGLLGYGWVAGRIAASRVDERRRARQRADHPFAEAVAKLIRNPATHQTVEWISKEAGLSTAEVVRGLGLLRSRNELMEDVDPASGSWFYWTTGQSQSLDSRLTTLEDLDEE